MRHIDYSDIIYIMSDHRIDNVISAEFGHRRKAMQPPPDTCGPEFTDALQDPTRLDAVADFLTERYRVGSVAIEAAREHLTFAGGEAEARLTDTMGVQSGAGNLTILASNKFPTLLESITGLGQAETIDLAANAVVAHGVLLAQRFRPAWQHSVARRIPVEDGFVPGRWNEVLRDREMVRTVHYRFAGAISLGMRAKSTPVFPPDMPEDLPLPSDIAGLVNPATPALTKAIILRYLQ